MKLAFEITLALALAFLLVLGGAMAIGVQRELRLLERDLRRDHTLLGARLASAVGQVWKRAGREEALSLLATEPGQGHFLARWHWLDEGSDLEPRLTSRQRAELQSGGPVTLATVGPDDVETRHTFVAVPTPEGLGAIELQERLLQQEKDAYAREIVSHAALTMGAVVAVSGLLAVALGVVLVGKPVRKLVDKARRVGAGDLSGEIVLAQRNELGELAREMNAMSQKLAATREQVDREAAERLATLEQLRHADRLTTIGKLASGIGHELGTPLAIVTGRAELILDGHAEGTAAHENAAIILDQARKMAAIIRQFLDFARRRHAQRSRQDVRTLLEQTLGLLRTLADRRGVSLELVGNGRSEWDLDPFQIQQAVANLVVNGIQATPPGRKLVTGYEILPDPRPEAAAAGEVLHLFVKDQGVGMAPEVLERAFEPFFTTKEIGEGTGLGLSIAQGIVRDHGGWIDATSVFHQGSRFSIWLPASEAS